MKALRTFFIMLMFISCKKGHELDCVKSRGDIVLQQRSVQPFKGVILNDRINLIIKVASQFAVEVEAGENVASGIATDVKGDVLVIEDQNKCNWVRKYLPLVNVKVTVPTLQSLVINGSGNVTGIDTIKADSISVLSFGPGTVKIKVNVPLGRYTIQSSVCDMHLSGFTGVSYVFARANGWIHASDMQTGYTYFWNQSSGDMNLSATKELSGRIDHRGNVILSAPPAVVNVKENSTGRLIYE